jgi:hypothetical protein
MKASKLPAAARASITLVCGAVDCAPITGAFAWAEARPVNMEPRAMPAEATSSPRRFEMAM